MAEVDLVLPFDPPTLQGGEVRPAPSLSRVHFASGKQDWGTPPELLKVLHEEFNFTADLAANADNHLLPVWLGPGHPTVECRDALTIPWRPLVGRGVGFCNPPYDRCADFLRVAHVELGHGVSSVFLIPARTDTKFWHDHVAAADEIRFLKGRLRFVGAVQGAPFPSCVVVFRGSPPGRRRWIGPRMVHWDWRG